MSGPARGRRFFCQISPVAETAVGLPSQEPQDQKGEAGVGALGGQGVPGPREKRYVVLRSGPGLWLKWFL